MTIDEAIEEQKNYLDDPFHDSSWRQRKATLLGIEALKRIKNQRITRIDLIDATLPGETED